MSITQTVGPLKNPEDCKQIAKSLKNDFKSIRDSGAYSDMTVSLSDGTRVRCHRAIMCARCDFFRNALESGFKESNNGIVEMLNDPPEAVHALIDFIYTGKYNFSENQDVADLICFHLDVLIIARTYVVKELQELAGRFIARNFMRYTTKAFQVLPEVANAFERLEISYCCGWGEKYSSLVDWAWHRKHYLLMNDDLVEALMEEASEFMRLVTRAARENWDYDCSEVALRWIERIEGAGSVEKIKRTVICPNCRFIQDRYVGTSDFHNLLCNICLGTYDLDEWEYVQSSTDGTDR